jgi:protein-S-isoprenylcysteine O-methyltransferase Ste14
MLGPGLANAVFSIGIVIAVAILAILVATLIHRPLRLWPTPGAGSWQSYIFWPPFRGLNVACFAMAVVDVPPGLGLPIWLRILASVVLAASIGTFLYSFFALGRDNSYGAQDGLVTSGIYQWTRNPQNAMLIVVYGALALAANSHRAALLCAAMMTVYALMVLAEEPWLEGIYGDAYRAYRREVPRFFNWSKAIGLLRRQ